jgi:ankyrin repeat protein
MYQNYKMEFIVRLIPFLFAAFVATTHLTSFGQSSVIDPMSIKSEVDSSSFLFERVLSESEPSKRYHSIKAFLDNSGPWITLQIDGEVARVHVTSYLLQKGMVEDAIIILKNNDVRGWLSYRFKAGVANDFMFALDSDSLDYIYALIDNSPSGINSVFPIDLAGNKASPLGILAAGKYADKPYYEILLTKLLNAGANPHLKLPSGISPMLIASSSNNMDFVRISQTYLSEQDSTVNGLLSNTPLASDQLLEMQAIADALIEKGSSETDNYNFEKLHSLWVQMILKGYNVPADLIYDLLVKREEFSIDYKSPGGLSALMSTSLSDLYGGNVEYAKKLMERGADPKSVIVVNSGNDGDIKINLIQLSLQKDNHKIIALSISKGVNFITLPDNDDIFILAQALEQKAFKSAFILKEALISAVAKSSK